MNSKDIVKPLSAQELADKIEKAVTPPAGRPTDYIRLSENAWKMVIDCLRASKS